MEMNYTLAWMLQTTRRLTFKGSSAIHIFVVVKTDGGYLSPLIISVSVATPSLRLSPNNKQTKDWLRSKSVLTCGNLPASLTDWRTVTGWIKYCKDQLFSIFQHSREEIVHICPVIRHERARTLFYSCWIFFVLRERKVAIDWGCNSLCKVSWDNSIIALIGLYLEL